MPSVQFLLNRIVIENFFKLYMPRQIHYDNIGVHVFYYITNNSNRHWLFNVSFSKYDNETVTGGFYQVKEHTRAIENIGFPIAPVHVNLKDDDFYWVNLESMFKWISSHSKVLVVAGFRVVTPFNDAFKFFVYKPNVLAV